MKTWTYEKLKAEGLIIFECIAGSRAFGTSTPESDTDIRFVYVLPMLDVLGLNYVEQVNNTSNDITGYEIRRLLELLATGNPTVIELLGMPEDVILYKHPVFDILLAQRDKFVTKMLKNSMAGYARQQIQKARGQDKMMNWEKAKVERKGPLDFCYITRQSFDGDQGGSQSFSEWLTNTPGITQSDFAVVPVPNMKDVYDLYDGSESTEQEGRKSWCKGIVGEDGESNMLRTSSIPKGVEPVGTLYYNKDGYSQHCKVYKQYQEWLEKRNPARWNDSQKHGQKIDGKNMLHCTRLLQMSREIASGQGVIVRRPNAQELLGIRRGEVDLEELLAWAEKEITVVDKLFDESTLPANVSDEFRDEILTEIRLAFYTTQEIRDDNLRFSVKVVDHSDY